MLLKNQMIIRLAGWAIARICRLWLCTLRVQWEHHGPDNDPLGAGNRGRMFCLWHEDMLTLGYACRGRGIYVLISRSKDGELITQVIERLGFQTVRGSTNRGGASAAREIITGLNGVSAAITPDGPRGPRREFQLGAVFLSSRTSMPLVPIGLAYERPWRLGSWDKLAIPPPSPALSSASAPRSPCRLERTGNSSNPIASGSPHSWRNRPAAPNPSFAAGARERSCRWFRRRRKPRMGRRSERRHSSYAACNPRITSSKNSRDRRAHAHRSPRASSRFTAGTEMFSQQSGMARPVNATLCSSR